ncbi:MAG: histidine kinase dimerization/phospho-acceptor domain-containing protein, partial [Gemmatimonadaceae bacterium]
MKASAVACTAATFTMLTSPKRSSLMAFSIPASRFDAPIIRWFAPPVLPSRESTRRAHALWMLAWPSFVVLAVLLSISIAASPDKLVRRATTIVVVGALTALLHEVSRRGRTEAASWMLVIGCTAILTQRAWGVGGIHAQVSMFYVLFVLMAGGLLGARGSVVTAFACLASAALLTAAAVAGWITAPVGAGSLVTAYLRVVLAIGLSLVIVNLLARQAQRAATEDLVQMFVHDMRSPLTVLVSRLSMLRDDAREGHLGEVTKGVDEAMVDVRTLNRLANDVLDISRLEMGRMPINLAPTDLGRVVHHVVG